MARKVVMGTEPGSHQVLFLQDYVYLGSLRVYTLAGASLSQPTPETVECPAVSSLMPPSPHSPTPISLLSCSLGKSPFTSHQAPKARLACLCGES